MNIRSNKIFIILLLISFSTLNLGCKKQDELQKSFEVYVNNDKEIVHDVFKNISPEGQHFLLAPKDLCRDCFRKIIDYFEQQEQKGQIILLGANDYDIKRLNSIYSNSLRFWKGEIAQYSELQSTYPAMVRGYVRYVGVKSDTLIYKGRGDNLTEQTQDVLDFYIKQNEQNG